MSQIGEKERKTQNRVVQLFIDELDYKYLGNWEDRKINRNIEEKHLRKWLSTKGNNNQGYSNEVIDKAVYQLQKTARDQSKGLYYVNKDVYSQLRYGIDVYPETGKNKIPVFLIDWENPYNNDFAIAEEVTINGIHKKRPDIVIYINGIAVGVLELKRSTVSVSEGIRQNLDNQKHQFIKPFFSTIQFVLAGNDTEGIAYGAIETEEKYYLKWKEVNKDRNPNDEYLLELTEPIRERAEQYEELLDKNITQMLNKERFIELIHDFIVFDRGDKKICRHNQYFGVKAAQDFVKRNEGGIIWHTQGSGKSLIMVWLTKWIREYNPNARVLIITDRDELDKQIEKVYKGVNENIYRTKSGRGLLEKLNSTSPWLLCSLIHKFGRKEEGDIDKYIDDLNSNVPTDYEAKGDFYVFVDECHRTQSGKLHDAMKRFLPDALFIGFTGTPLLKKDKPTSLEVFGRYIHKYKFDEAVNDNIILDLRYEARDVEQKITSEEKIDEWFDIKTRGLTDYAKNELKSKWGTIRKVYSSKSRLEKIVMDIMLDMERKERFQNGRGNALLVSDSIYNACRYYQLFQDAGLEKCAIVTSFAPSYVSIKGEETGETGYTERLKSYEIYQDMLSDYYNEDPDIAINKVDEFEDDVKKQFVEEPAQMKLLIVVNKLLTGFDAPSATYLYLDKKMRDHGLFQAVCRVNRLDGEDKDYGYIIDYMDLFKSLENAYHDYTSEAFDAYDKEDVQGLLKDRLDKGEERLKETLETVRALCEPVKEPKNRTQYIQYFCGDDTQDPEKLKDTKPKRLALYKHTSSLVRAFANIADEMLDIGYLKEDIYKVREEVRQYESIKKEIQLASGDYVDLKRFEPAMRHLIDSYIGAEESRMLNKFDDFSLVELLVEKGREAMDDIPENIRKEPEAMSETIENNLRKVIVERRPSNPEYYRKMSELLDELIQRRKEATQEYEEYLQEIVELAKQIEKPDSTDNYPDGLATSAQRSLYDNLGQDKKLALELDEKIKSTKKDGWRDHLVKTREVEIAIDEVLEKHQANDVDVEYVVDLVKQQKDY